MRYAIIDKDKAVGAGISTALHRMNAKKTKMAVNENELLMLGDDPSVQAEALGGSLLTLTEAKKAMALWDIE